MMRILIGAAASGCGKTTVTCALLKAFQMRGLSVSSFKCGPDYIDPMFHREVVGAPSANLDSFFCEPDALREILHRGSAGTDIAVIEGVMGYYDGMDSGSSAYDIAGITQTPAVIVINARGMSESMGALMQGFLHYREDARICGFVFNQLPVSLTGRAKELCASLHTHYLGYLPRTDISLESRNLGLVTAAEVPQLQEKIERLGDLAAQHLDLDLLMHLADCGAQEETARRSAFSGMRITDHEAPVIAVARDRAFCFRYPENLYLLEEAGCRIRYFSPLEDEFIPEDADGLYLCGGYPELHARRLSENISMRKSIRDAVLGGMPAIAECGGFLYLHQELRMEDGSVWPMAGILDAAAFPKRSLQRFGYVTLTAQADNLLCEKGDQIRAHAFHYWDSENPGSLFNAQKPDGRSWRSGIGSETLYAGFPHLYFPAKPQIAQRFAVQCLHYAKRGTAVL